MRNMAESSNLHTFNVRGVSVISFWGWFSLLTYNNSIANKYTSRYVKKRKHFYFTVNTIKKMFLENKYFYNYNIS